MILTISWRHAFAGSRGGRLASQGKILFTVGKRGHGVWKVHDPHASNDEINHEYGFELIPEINGQYEAVIVAVNHSDYLTLGEDYFNELLSDNGVLVDVKGIYRNSIKGLNYLSF